MKNVALKTSLLTATHGGRNKRLARRSQAVEEISHVAATKHAFLKRVQCSPASPSILRLSTSVIADHPKIGFFCR